MSRGRWTSTLMQNVDVCGSGGGGDQERDPGVIMEIEMLKSGSGQQSDDVARATPSVTGVQDHSSRVGALAKPKRRDNCKG